MISPLLLFFGIRLAVMFRSIEGSTQTVQPYKVIQRLLSRLCKIEMNYQIIILETFEFSLLNNLSNNYNFIYYYYSNQII